MPDRFPCNSCGTPIELEGWERGTEVYCPVCGKSNREPPKGEVRDAASISSAPEIFGEKAIGNKAARVVAQVDCPGCGLPVPVTVLDYGDSTYCQACGAEVPVGEAFVVESQPRPTTGASIATPSRPKAGGPRPLQVPLVVMVALAIISTAGMALIAGRRPLPKARPMSPSASTRAVVPPDAFITLEAIEKLAGREPVDVVLAQAQDWLEMLLDEFKVSSNDRRIVRLDAMIKDFQERLLPKPIPDPPEVAQFNDQFATLSRTLKSLPAGKIPGLAGLVPARKAIAEADDLLVRHPGVLEPRAGPYRKLRAEVAALVALLEGSRPIIDLLEAALREVEAGHPTKGLENLARARLLAVGTKLDDAHRADLNARIDAIVNQGRLSMALCLRSLDEAEKADRMGDDDTRSWLSGLARAQLQRAMAKKAGDYRAIENRLKTLEATPRDERRRKDPPADLVVRRAFEKELESFANWLLIDTDAWVDGAMKLRDNARRMSTEQRSWAEASASLALGGLRARVDALGESEQMDAPAEIAANAVLAAVRQALDKLDFWNGRPEWRSLDAELRRRGNEIGRRLMARAEQMRQDERPAEAIAAAELAEQLTSEPDLTGRARSLKEECRAELALRADQKAQDEAWERLQKLFSDGGMLGAWSELIQFERRFPDSPHAKELGRLKQEVEFTLRRQAPELLGRGEALKRAGRNEEFHRLVDRLGSFPVPPEQRALWDSLQRDHAELNRQADELFARIPPSMSTRDDIIAVLDQLADTLKLNPNHARALARRQQAWERGKPHAAELLQTAELMKKTAIRLDSTQREAQRRRLSLLLKISPRGELAGRAREMLEELGG